MKESALLQKIGKAYITFVHQARGSFSETGKERKLPCVVYEF